MSHGWSTPAVSNPFDDILAFDMTEGSQLQYQPDPIPGFDDSWFSTTFAHDAGFPDVERSQSALGEAGLPNDMDDGSLSHGFDQIESFLETLEHGDLSANHVHSEYNPPPWSGSTSNQITGETATSMMNQDREYMEHWAFTNDVVPHRSSEHVPLEHSNPQSSMEPTASSSAKSNKRTKISQETHTMLDEYFAQEPYPSEGEVTLLCKKTGLPRPVLRAWFSNARSRKQVLQRE